MNFCKNQRGIALFISLMLTVSLALIALAMMSRVSEAVHASGKDLQERRMLAYAHSATNLANGDLRNLIDSTYEFLPTYSVTGGLGQSEGDNKIFKYYPRDITIAATLNENENYRPLFAYRAFARKITTDPNANPYGLNSENKIVYGVDTNACYDVTIDVREVVFVGPSAYITDTDDSIIEAKPTWSLGRMKTVGMVSCFAHGEDREE